MKRYTLAFIFNTTLDRVLLVHKLAPDWQVGKLNGVGGKIEEKEDELACIMREVKEETGLIIKENQWIYLGDMGSPSWHSHVYTAIYTGKLSDARKMDKEEIEWFDADALPENTICNLPWLIPLAKDRIAHQEFEKFSVRYIL